jgi:hypothetical protein
VINREFVLKPRFKYDGWFRRTGVSVEAGPSGSDKTTVMLDLLHKQQQGKRYLNHEPGKFDFRILYADRKKDSWEETLERTGLLCLQDRCEPLPLVYGLQAVAAIKAAIERHNQPPPVVFVEAADALVDDPNKVQSVAPFLGGLQEIAEQYNCALILSVGCPKLRTGQGYVHRRDRIPGSQIWGRMTDTLVELSFDEETGVRQLDILHRNAEEERFYLKFQDGLLVECPAPAAEVDLLIEWLRQQDEWFSPSDRHEEAGAVTGIGRSQFFSRLAQLAIKGTIERRKIDGRTVEYRWKRPERMPDAEVLNRVPSWTPESPETITQAHTAQPRPDETEVYAEAARTPEPVLDEVA